MQRRSFLLSALALGTTGPAAAQGMFSDDPISGAGLAPSPYPYRQLGADEMVAPPPPADVVPPTYAMVGDVLDPNAPTQAEVETLKVPVWENFFPTPAKGMIVCSIAHRVVHFRSEDGKTQRAYLCSVPRSGEFERRGRTSITEKRHSPTWIPTPDMRKRDPSLPERVGPGPSNPLGTRALNLGWPYYRIHGIDKPAKVGQAVSSGCFGLYNHAIEELFDMVVIGTQVVVV
jgi:lipoprotein-anchoring transpeptidase ErfK/SrfK